MGYRRVVSRLLLAGVALAGAGTISPATATITTTSSPTSLATAALSDPGQLAGAAFVSLPPSGTPHAVSDSALGGFAINGATYAILTTGDATLADDPNSNEGSGFALGGPSVRGNTDYDVSVLRVDLNVASGKNCLLLDFRFLSEEYPEYVGDVFNDAFIAELNASTWTTSGSSISAPDNFAFDPSGDVISINATGVANMTAAEAAGTTYDGATRILSAATPLSASDANGGLAGNNSLFMSIFDQGDSVFDSAVFVDNVRTIAVSNPATQCLPGARASTELVARPAILEAPKVGVYAPNLGARLTEVAGSGIAGKTIDFYATNALTGMTSLICIGVTDSSGFATCGSPLTAAMAVLGLGYEARFDGDATYGPSSGSAKLVRVSGQDLP